MIASRFLYPHATPSLPLSARNSFSKMEKCYSATRRNNADTQYGSVHAPKMTNNFGRIRCFYCYYYMQPWKKKTSHQPWVSAYFFTSSHSSHRSSQTCGHRKQNRGKNVTVCGCLHNPRWNTLNIQSVLLKQLFKTSKTPLLIYLRLACWFGSLVPLLLTMHTFSKVIFPESS